MKKVKFIKGGKPCQCGTKVFKLLSKNKCECVLCKQVQRVK